jgi:hypothetical protein
MNTHAQVDHRSLRLAWTIVGKLEAGDVQAGIDRARSVNHRWRAQAASRLHDDWAAILQGDWPSIRRVLLDESERGAQLRQNNPFCGILTPQERWAIVREASHEA